MTCETRIVSLLPSTTEILFAIGAGESVVGITHECDYPPAAQRLPRLTRSMLADDARAPADIDRHVRASIHAGSSLYELDSALLAKLEPDLIVTQELCVVCAVSYDIVERAAKRLRRDPRVVSLEPSSLDDVYANIIFIGELTGHDAGADAVVKALQLREAVLRASIAPASRPRVLVLEWTDPPMSGGHWTPGLVELAGGEPVLANPGANSQVVSWDAVAAADPDVVIAVPCGFDLSHARAAVAGLAKLPQWVALRARTHGRAFVMDGNAFVNRPGPRLLDSAEIFAEALRDTIVTTDAIERVG